jgi:RimJ/RimL family protein N-acetyltransferase
VTDETTASGEGAVPTSGHETEGEPSGAVGILYAWWRADPLPSLPAVPGATMAPCRDESLIATLMDSDAESIRERFDQGHQPWLARIEGEPAGWGWVAGSQAAIGELGITLTLRPGDRYLWDFATPRSWRGRGVYPALLQAILAEEGAARYWIGHDVGNTASARGIVKAGFREVGTVHRMADGKLTFIPDGPTDHAEAATDLLGLPVTRQ